LTGESSWVVEGDLVSAADGGGSRTVGGDWEWDGGCWRDRDGGVRR